MLKKIMLLIPTEVLALYLSIKPVVGEHEGTWAVICLLICLFVRYRTTSVPGQPVQGLAIAISCISFVLWVYASGSHIASYKLPPGSGTLLTIAVAVWSFLVPYFYQGEKS